MWFPYGKCHLRWFLNNLDWSNRYGGFENATCDETEKVIFLMKFTKPARIRLQGTRVYACNGSFRPYVGKVVSVEWKQPLISDSRRPQKCVTRPVWVQQLMWILPCAVCVGRAATKMMRCWSIWKIVEDVKVRLCFREIVGCGPIGGCRAHGALSHEDREGTRYLKKRSGMLFWSGLSDERW